MQGHIECLKTCQFNASIIHAGMHKHRECCVVYISSAFTLAVNIFIAVSFKNANIPPMPVFTSLAKGIYIVLDIR
jgi:hypothetical protein